jgi:hypothetical protein
MKLILLKAFQFIKEKDKEGKLYCASKESLNGEY